MSRVRLDREHFSAREEVIAQALLGTTPKWVEAATNDIEFRNALWYVTRTLSTLLDNYAAKLVWGIEDLDLSIRAYNVLKREGVNTVDQLVKLSWADLADFRNMGAKGINDVEDRLARVGLKLKGEE